jgi:cytochrome c-type biogenesis protein CcmF
MLVDLGNDALWLTMLLAITTSVCGFMAREKYGVFFPIATRLGSVAAFAFNLAAFFILIYAYVVSDFSVGNVFQNSHTAKPLLYKIAGAWGNHEGSMILWTLIASFFGLILALRRLQLSTLTTTRILATQALLVAGFSAFVLFTSNPFTELFPAPLEGRGLNPVLQDPALAIHPPMLYLGYVGFSLAFSFAVGGLLTREISRGWAAALRPFVLIAWCALTLGIALGSWWAYYELGWGGWWFWDPVENASFIPWLAGTALLHCLITLEKRGSLKTWAVLLALTTFTLSLVGTFLVRSGIITSVHAFALDPERGVFILLLIGLTSGAGFLLFALRAGKMEAETDFAPLSRESLLVLNNIFLVSGAATVLLGTLYPLILEMATGEQISVGAPYFESAFVPLMMPLVLLMGLAPFVAWQKDAFQRFLPSLKTAFLITASIVLILLMTVEGKALRFYLGLGLALWLFSTSLAGWLKTRRQTAMTVAHMGLAVALCGMVTTSHLSSQAIDLMNPGDTLRLQDLTFHFDQVERLPGPNYEAERATFTVSSAKGTVATLAPERRLYPEAGKILSEVAISTSGFYDLYLVLGEAQLDDDKRLKGWTVRAYIHPLIPWIWIGCVIMAMGGGMALLRRHKAVI